MSRAESTIYAKPRPGWLMRQILRVPPVLYRGSLAVRLGPRLLVLTTTGRRTGRPRSCGLNYAQAGGTIYVASGFGLTDWYRNLLADPRVDVRIGRHVWPSLARPVTDPAERRAALQLLGRSASHQGPPRLLRPFLRRLGLDYDAEVRRLVDPELVVPTVAIDRRVPGG